MMDRLRGSAGLVGFFVMSVLAVSACSGGSADSTVDSAVGPTVDSAVDPSGSSVSSTFVTTLPAPPRASYDPDELEFERSRRMLRPVGDCGVHYLYGVLEAAAKYSPDDPLAGFVKAGDVDGFSAALDGVDDPGDLDKAIELAASSGCVELIEVALDHGANPDVRWDDFYPSPLFLAVASQSPGAVALLVEAGADLNATTYERESPLHLAVGLEATQPFGSGMVEIVRILLEAGGDPNLESALDESTPLTLATEKMSLPMVQVLLEGGAVPRPDGLLATAMGIDPGASYDPDELALELARRMLRSVGDCESHYLYGVLEAAVNYLPDDPLVGLVKAGDVDGFSAALDGVDDPGDLDKAIDLAASSGCVELIEVALDHGANPNAAFDNYHRSPLWAAVVSQSPGAVALLVEAGADPNATTYERESPLHLAVGLANVEMVRILLAAGGDPNLESHLGQWTPLTIATEKMSLPIVQVLLDGGAVPRPDDLLVAARAIENPLVSYPATAITGAYLERGVRLDGWVPEENGEVGSLLLSEGNDVAVEYIEWYLNRLGEES